MPPRTRALALRKVLELTAARLNAFLVSVVVVVVVSVLDLVAEPPSTTLTTIAATLRRHGV